MHSIFESLHHRHINDLSMRKYMYIVWENNVNVWFGVGEHSYQGRQGLYLQRPHSLSPAGSRLPINNKYKRHTRHISTSSLYSDRHCNGALPFLSGHRSTLSKVGTATGPITLSSCIHWTVNISLCVCSV